MVGLVSSVLALKEVSSLKTGEEYMSVSVKYGANIGGGKHSSGILVTCVHEGSCFGCVR